MYIAKVKYSEFTPVELVETTVPVAGGDVVVVASGMTDSLGKPATVQDCRYIIDADAEYLCQQWPLPKVLGYLEFFRRQDSGNED